MNIKTAVQGQIDRQLNPKGSIQTGVIVTYNAKARTVDIQTSEGGNNIIYSNVLLPSLGTGVKLQNIKPNTPVIFSFIGGTKDFPVILSILTGNGLTPDNAEDVNMLGVSGRLSLRGSL